MSPKQHFQKILQKYHLLNADEDERYEIFREMLLSKEVFRPVIRIMGEAEETLADIYLPRSTADLKILGLDENEILDIDWIIVKLLTAQRLLTVKMRDIRYREALHIQNILIDATLFMFTEDYQGLPLGNKPGIQVVDPRGFISSVNN